MDYELAKELKDAGFPQEGKGGYLVWTDSNLVALTNSAYEPTLEELIEACGDRFSSLYQFYKPIAGNYRATAWQANSIEGPTPLIAVAKLWLALQKK